MKVSIRNGGRTPTIVQKFHKNFFDLNNLVQQPFFDFAVAAHQEMWRLNECLNTDLELIDDLEVVKALEKIQEWKRERLDGIEEALRRLEDGTFTFQCEEVCPCHQDRGGHCRGDIREEKLVMPEVTNCVAFRQHRECGAPIKALLLSA